MTPQEKALFEAVDSPITPAGEAAVDESALFAAAAGEPVAQAPQEVPEQNLGVGRGEAILRSLGKGATMPLSFLAGTYPEIIGKAGGVLAANFPEAMGRRPGEPIGEFIERVELADTMAAAERQAEGEKNYPIQSAVSQGIGAAPAATAMTMGGTGLLGMAGLAGRGAIAGGGALAGGAEGAMIARSEGITDPADIATSAVVGAGLGAAAPFVPGLVKGGVQKGTQAVKATTQTLGKKIKQTGQLADQMLDTLGVDVDVIRGAYRYGKKGISIADQGMRKLMQRKTVREASAVRDILEEARGRIGAMKGEALDANKSPVSAANILASTKKKLQRLKAVTSTEARAKQEALGELDNFYDELVERVPVYSDEVVDDFVPRQSYGSLQYRSQVEKNLGLGEKVFRPAADIKNVDDVFRGTQINIRRLQSKLVDVLERGKEISLRDLDELKQRAWAVAGETDFGDRFKNAPQVKRVLQEFAGGLRDRVADMDETQQVRVLNKLYDMLTNVTDDLPNANQLVNAQVRDTTSSGRVLNQLLDPLEDNADELKRFVPELKTQMDDLLFGIEKRQSVLDATKFQISPFNMKQLLTGAPARVANLFGKGTQALSKIAAEQSGRFKEEASQFVYQQARSNPGRFIRRLNGWFELPKGAMDSVMQMPVEKRDLLLQVLATNPVVIKRFIEEPVGLDLTGHVLPEEKPYVVDNLLNVDEGDSVNAAKNLNKVLDDSLKIK